MEWVRLYLGLYALFGVVVLAVGLHSLFPNPGLSAGLFAAGGFGILVVSTVGATRSPDALSKIPPVWVVAVSSVALLSLIAAVTLKVA